MIPQGHYDEMKIDKYYIKRAYSNNRFREVRAKVNTFLMKDQMDSLRVGETVSRLAHNQKKTVRLSHPLQ